MLKKNNVLLQHIIPHNQSADLVNGHTCCPEQHECFLQDCAFHPAKKLLAVGLINGGIRVFDCSGAELNQCASWDKHSDSCRSLVYTDQGDTILSGSADKSLRGFDAETGKAVFRMKNAHDCAIER